MSGADRFRDSEWPLDRRIIQKFEEMVNSSPRGVVEDIDMGNCIVIPNISKKRHIQRFTKYFFTEVVHNTNIYRGHHWSGIFKPVYLSLALESFANESARLQQIGQQVLADAWEDDDDDIEDMEWTPGCDEEDGSIEEDDGGNDDHEDVEGADDACHDYLATPIFDALFPPVDESTMTCIPTLVIKRMWCACMRDDLRFYNEKVFFGMLERALNAYVKTMLIEPRCLDWALGRA